MKMVKRIVTGGSSSSSKAKKSTSESPDVCEARLEAERRTKIFDEEKAAYDAARGELMDLEKVLPRDIVLITKALDTADIDETDELKDELKIERQKLGPEGKSVLREWNAARADLPALEKARVEAFENKKAADEALKQLRDKKAREAAAANLRRADSGEKITTFHGLPSLP